MRLLHPFMPFITEEIWQTIPHEGESIMIQRYPTPDTWTAPEMERRFHLLEQAMGLVRASRMLLNYPPGQQINFDVAHDDPTGQAPPGPTPKQLAHLGRGTVGRPHATRLAAGNAPPIRRRRA